MLLVYTALLVPMQLSFWQRDDPCWVPRSLPLDLFADAYFLVRNQEGTRDAEQGAFCARGLENESDEGTRDKAALDAYNFALCHLKCEASGYTQRGKSIPSEETD